MRASCLTLLLAVSLVLLLPPAQAAEQVNVYTSRKEALIRPLFDRFTEKTAVQVRVLSADAGALLARLEKEGRNTPADLLLTVDAGNLYRAREAGVLQPVSSAVLDAAIPATYRDPQGYWYGLSQRARVIFRASARVKEGLVTSYSDLSDPAWRGRVCIRSSGNIYNQSLVASMIATQGEAKTEAWARGLVENMARPPQGGDTDQIRALAAGLCDLAVANTYYFGRMLASEDQRDIAEKIDLIWPDQGGRGAHVNVSGAGITRFAKNPENALELLEFLAGPEAQAWYAEMNHEFPVRPGIEPSAILAGWGTFEADDINLAQLGDYNAEAVRLMDRAGWR